jgi:hypothetical protein
VAVGEQGDQQPIEQVLLPDDDARHFALQGGNPGRIVEHALAGGAQCGIRFGRHGARFGNHRKFLIHRH